MVQAFSEVLLKLQLNFFDIDSLLVLQELQLVSEGLLELSDLLVPDDLGFLEVLLLNPISEGLVPVKSEWV